jgi:hypothetical protein
MPTPGSTEAARTLRTNRWQDGGIDLPDPNDVGVYLEVAAGTFVMGYVVRPRFCLLV